MITFTRPAVGTVVFLMAGFALSGCSLMPSPVICVSWASFETPQDALDDSVLAIIGQPLSADRTVNLFGEPAAVHNVEVERVLKGSVDVGDEVSVISTPVTCSGGEVYPDGDPLDRQESMALFLNETDGHDEWRLLSPLQGTLEVEQGVEPTLGAW